ncbi:MAG: hypothetical protein GY786_04015 [Proteobacteria bacterium]|nr:hypothetical protein [Pseudomonadota bacterium]
MEPTDKKFVVPIVFLLMVGIIIWNSTGSSLPWYENEKDYQISEIKVTDLAGWIIQSRNDFVPVFINNDDNHVIDDIPSIVSLNSDQNLEEQIRNIPDYKKWILITADGSLSDDIAEVLTKDWKHQIVLLHGGMKNWKDKITAPSIRDLELARMERVQLNNVRPFFQNTYHSSPKGQLLERFTATPVTAPPLLAEEEEEEEEGC